jgi:hypothetical protein
LDSCCDSASQPLPSSFPAYNTRIEARALPKSLPGSNGVSRLSQSLDRDYLAAVGLNCKHGTGFHGFTIHQDGAGAAKRTFASDVGASESGDIADVMYEQDARLNVTITRLSIQSQINPHNISSNG